jgi:hypothetical protein
MLALFNIGVEQNNIDWKSLHEKAVNCAKEDFYLHHPGHLCLHISHA